MGRLVDGKWIKTSIITSDDDGAYDRIPRSFRDTISKDHDTFKPESGRYHLYVSYACPWAHRTLIYRKLKGLEEHISVSVVSPDMLDMGWTFETNISGATGDDLYGLNYLQEIYTKADPEVSTSVTVPVLWDKKTQRIVNNESSEIIRIFNKEFNELTGNTDDYYPKELASEIDELNDFIYPNINNGVYRSGFAKKQEAYESAVTRLFDALDKVEEKLEGNRFLLGERLTEADLRLVPTLLRFDCVYVTHFKCNLKRIKDYKNLSRYLKELYEMKAISETTNFEHIKRHYFYSHEDINPYRIVALGPSEII
ncbi:glutathione S-transferase family protein [Halobacteriovorax sp. Y22]|uniref:glutathione S-transferase family protein n=1 Tax=Halobacteriovorax sp. Y22 TaxID=2505978 RepID=UPI00108066C6|nr:glutathione S-transferase family protein [Halobacteriovorax sp. Y22]TGD48747.1 glutathione S-transferase family protein [Halobacteriovorax sp. Y22]